MIEVIYQGHDGEETSGEIRLPKNVRQIGDATEDKRKIYVEDFVMSFVKHFNCKDYKYGVLLGNFGRKGENTYLFIEGAVLAKPAIDNEVLFDEDVWTGIYEDIKTYFENVEVVGWFLSTPGIIANDMAMITKIHLDHFAGNNKVCFLIDRAECEDTFFAYENGELKKCGGHYIYYEKNGDMQSYMIMNEDKAEETVEGRKTINAKVHKILYKKPEKELEPKSESNTKIKKIPVFNYSASTVFVVAVLTLAVALMHTKGKLNDLEGRFTRAVNAAISDEKESNTKAVTTSGNISESEIIPETSTIAEKETDETALWEQEELTQVAVSGNEDETQAVETQNAETQTQVETQTEFKPVAQIEPQKRTYEVKAGDSLYSISKHIYGNIDMIGRIRQENHMGENDDKITEGDILILP